MSIRLHRHGVECVHVEQAGVGDLELRYDRQRHEAQLHERIDRLMDAQVIPGQLSKCVDALGNVFAGMMLWESWATLVAIAPFLSP